MRPPIKAKLVESLRKKWEEFSANGAQMKIEGKEGKPRPMEPRLAYTMSGFAKKQLYCWKILFQPVTDGRRQHVGREEDVPGTVVYEKPAVWGCHMRKGRVEFKELNIWSNTEATDSKAVNLAINTTYQPILQIYERFNRGPNKLVSTVIIPETRFRTISSPDTGLVPVHISPTGHSAEIGSELVEESRPVSSGGPDAVSEKPAVTESHDDTAEVSLAPSHAIDSSTEDSATDVTHSDGMQLDDKGPNFEDKDLEEPNLGDGDLEELNLGDGDLEEPNSGDVDFEELNLEAEDFEEPNLEAAVNSISVKLAKQQQKEWDQLHAIGAKQRVKTRPGSIIPKLCYTVNGAVANKIYRVDLTFEPIEEDIEEDENELRTVVYRLKVKKTDKNGNQTEEEDICGKDLMETPLDFNHLRTRTVNVDTEHQVRLELNTVYQPVLKIFEVNEGAEILVSTTVIAHTAFTTVSLIKNASIRALRMSCNIKASIMAKRAVKKRKKNTLESQAQVKKARIADTTGSDAEDDDEDEQQSTSTRDPSTREEPDKKLICEQASIIKDLQRQLKNALAEIAALKKKNSTSE